MVGIWRRRLPFLCGCALLLGLGAAVAADKTDLPRASADDPRSGAALNVEAAKAALAAGKPPKAGPAPDPAPQIIFHSPVNNRFADTATANTQSETTVLDLGGGNLVGAFTDTGSIFSGTGSNHLTGYVWSNNNGVSWTDPGALPDSAGGDRGNAVLAHRRAGNTVLLATMAFTNRSILQVFRSTNNGRTFLAPVSGTPGFPAGDSQEKPWLAVDNFAGSGAGNAYLCWTRFGGPTINVLVTRSTDGGATFGPSGGTFISGGGLGCFVAVSPNHQVNVFYYRGTGVGGQAGDNKIFLRRSTDLGVTFGAEVQVADLNTTSFDGDVALNGGVRSNSFPHAAVNPVAARPYIYVVYNDIAPAVPSIKSDAYYVRSLDGGSTWSAPLRLNDDLAGDQFFPTLAFVNAGERLMFGYYSRSQDASNLLFHRRGRLGVLNAAGNLVLNPSFQLGPNTPIVVRQDRRVDPAYMGGYDTIAGGVGAFASLWSDNRLPPANGLGFPYQPDVRFARIAAPPPAADLAVTVATSTPGVNLGDAAVFTVTARATGGAANDVFINIPSVPGLIVQSFNLTVGQCSNVDGVVGCSLGSIAAGTSRTIRLFAATAVAAGTRTLTARGTTSSAETNAANNTGSQSVAVAAGGAVAAVYTTGNIAVSIPDGSLVIVPLTVPATGGNVLNILAYVRLNHTFVQDLSLFLRRPDGRSVPLVLNRGGAGDNFGSGANNCTGVPTTFTDLAATPIASGVAPFAGLFKPEQPLLNTFFHEPADGPWTLTVTDFNVGNVGTIGCFRLFLLRTAP